MKILTTVEGTDDKVLLEAVAKYFKDHSGIPSIKINEETWVSLKKEDFLRVIELAEIGLKFLQTTEKKMEKQAEEDAKQCEERPDPHFISNSTDKMDCDLCLCESCITNCLSCDRHTVDCKDCEQSCAVLCANVNCPPQGYVNSCSAYNDGHGF